MYPLFILFEYKMCDTFFLFLHCQGLKSNSGIINKIYAKRNSSVYKNHIKTHSVMSKKVFLYVLLVGCILQSVAQNITVSSAVGQDPDSFVNTTLAGKGVLLFNAKFNNSANGIYTDQIGVFRANGFTDFQMDSGIVMTTGQIWFAPGPNRTGNGWYEVNNFYSDPQMELVATSTINGCATLDFDFIGLSDAISFMYTFASEEYPEFVCSAYNDVFAFFITGPDPETGMERTWNVAIIPETVTDSTPNGVAVAINTVNPGEAGANGGFGEGCRYDFSSYYTANRGAEGVQYDGYTVKLTAETNIIPCAVYHMHLSVCNVGDNLLDSGVFLEYGSFSSPISQLGFEQQVRDTVRTGCTTVIPFDMSNSLYEEGMVHITFGGNAVKGVDYECMNEEGDYLNDGSSFYISQDDLHYIEFTGMPGANVDEPKYIELYLETSVCLQHPELIVYDTMHFVMSATAELEVKDTVFESDYVCTHVSTNVVSGLAPFSFRWEPTDGLANPYAQSTSAFITDSTIYHVFVTDRNGCRIDTAIVTVNINKPQTLGISEGENGQMKVYPNPASEWINIEANQLKEARIFDVHGRQVFSVNNLHGNKEQIPTKGLTTGIYYLQIVTSDSLKTIKLTINND